MPDPERTPWDRRPGETARAYDAFRRFLALPAAVRTVRKVAEAGTTQAKNWSYRWDWTARATAWEDHMARLEDAERVESLRAMHGTHQRAARAVQQYALAALSRLDPAEASPGDVARLLDLGTRLERATLTTSVEELQGRPRVLHEDDPWSQIASELADWTPPRL